MADETQAADTQAESPPSPQAGTQADSTQAEPEVETISLDEAKKLRSENANLRKRAKELEEFEKSHLSEQEKRDRDYQAAMDRATELEQRLRETRAVAVAARIGAIYPDDVAKLMPSDLDLDDDRAVAQWEKDYRRARPLLFHSEHGSADGGTRTVKTEPDATPGMGRILRGYEKQQPRS